MPVKLITITEHGESIVKLIAVFANYRGDIPDTHDIFWCLDDESAKHFVNVLNRLRSDDSDAPLMGYFPFVDGYLNKIGFKTRKVLVLKSKFNDCKIIEDDMFKAFVPVNDAW